jgi:uncharacterized protein
LSNSNILWFYVLSLVAEILGTIGGFGSSVFFVPFANIFFDFHVVLGITAIFHLSSNLSKIYLFREGLDKQLLLKMGIPSVIFVILGGYLSSGFSSGILQLTLGIFLVVLSLLFLVKDKLIIRKGNTEIIGGGALSGFVAGLLGTGGAIRGLTLAAFNMEKSVFVATSAAIDMAIDTTRTFVYWDAGYLTYEILWYIPVLLLIGFVGSWLGQKILVYIPQTRFKQFSLILVLLIGIFTVIRWWII